MKFFGNVFIKKIKSVFHPSTNPCPRCKSHYIFPDCTKRNRMRFRDRITRERIKDPHPYADTQIQEIYMRMCGSCGFRFQILSNWFNNLE